MRFRDYLKEAELGPYANPESGFIHVDSEEPKETIIPGFDASVEDPDNLNITEKMTKKVVAKINKYFSDNNIQIIIGNILKTLQSFTAKELFDCENYTSHISELYKRVTIISNDTCILNESHYNFSSIINDKKFDKYYNKIQTQYIFPHDVAREIIVNLHKEFLNSIKKTSPKTDKEELARMIIGLDSFDYWA